MEGILELKAAIIAQLKTLPVCKPSSNLRNWVVRCPYCGDSRTENHGHFSILIDPFQETTMIYRCFKCNESGMFTEQQMEDLGLYINPDQRQKLHQFNHRAAANTFYLDKPKNYKVLPIENPTAEVMRKLSYVNERLGSNISVEDAANYKIILSLAQFLRDNNLKISTKKQGENIVPMYPKTLATLEENYVGFLSSNNNKITFRDISPKGDSFLGRYYKLTLDLFNQSKNTFYSLLNRFDLLYDENIEVHIAEGTFDILGAWLNLSHIPSQNALYFANCGFGFGTILKYLISMGVGTDINLHIYSDRDKSDEDHLEELKKCRLPLDIWVDHLYIHRNLFEGEKDYGVPKERIIDSCYEIKIGKN